jgi:hypothetical protein
MLVPLLLLKQVQRSFNEVAKSAKKCLDEASKYGEVRECYYIFYIVAVFG